MKTKSIVFIGMPASGKSSIAKALAKYLNWEYVDADRLIEENQGVNTLKEIIDRVGNEEFLEIENKVNSSIKGDHLVIAPGGSVIFCEDAMKNYRENSVIVYLKISYYLLNERIGDPIKRGVILEEGQTIKDVFHIRKKYFEKYAHITFRMKNYNIKKTVKKLLDKLEDNGINLEKIKKSCND